MEEEHLYGPVSRETKDPALTAWPDRHAHEVHEAEQLIAAITRQSPKEREWLQDVKRLQTALEGHIREEEQDIWPKIEKVWGHEQLEEAGRKMEAMKTTSAKGTAKR